jgi:hypothetical protein
MGQQTYDPILSSEELSMWRLTKPLRPPGPGRALVLDREGGPSLTVRNGEAIESPRFGLYHRAYTVDLGEHRLILDFPLLSRDPGFSFRSRVELVCRVVDPAKVVARGIRDMSDALYGPLRKTLRGVARNYDIAEFHEAERALNDALSDLTGDDAIRLRSVQVELLVDEDEVATSGREFRNIQRETRLEGMRRRRHLDMINEEGIDGLIAGIMEREGPRAALAWIEKGEAEKREVRREVRRMVLERGDADREPFEQAELERAVLEEAFRDGDGLFEAAATRRGRLRGTAARALEPADEEKTETSRDEEAGSSHGAREPLKGEVLGEKAPSAPRISGLRGAGRAVPSGPPADEPLPSPHEPRYEPPPPRTSRVGGSAMQAGPDGAKQPPVQPEKPAESGDRRVSRVRGTAKKRPDDGSSGSRHGHGERR